MTFLAVHLKTGEKDEGCEGRGHVAPGIRRNDVLVYPLVMIVLEILGQDVPQLLFGEEDQDGVVLLLLFLQDPDLLLEVLELKTPIRVLLTA